DPWSYHALNLAIHALAGIVLFDLVRRLLERRGAGTSLASSAAGIALAAALLWVVHPVTTEAVTYVIQRGESMASLFYLLTLDALVRSAQSAHARRWHVAAVGFCLLGMISKPVMVTAPIMALLIDRVFLAGSFRRL